MEKANLQVVRFNAEDVITTSYFAMNMGGTYDLYQGTRANVYYQDKGYPVTAEYVNSYSDEDFESSVSHNILYSTMYDVYSDGSDLYSFGKRYPTDEAIVGGQGAANTPGENPPFPFGS